MLTITAATYPAHGDPRHLLASRSLPSASLGTLEYLIPGLLSTSEATAPISSRERTLHKRLTKRILDASDAMLIPQAAGAYDIALSLTDSLYDTRRYRMKVSLPYSAVDAIHPGTVLIAAIAELALALRSKSSGKAPFEPDRMRALSDWLGGYCELQPLGREIRRAAPHQLYTLIQQLLLYYA